MEPDYIRSIPCTREQTPVVVPHWLRTYAQAWSSQGAAAVVLFGSRAQGRALTISDWDVAVVFLDQHEVPNKNSVRLSDSVHMGHEVNPILVKLNDLNPAFMREIGSGISLCGDFKLICNEYFEKDVLSVDRSDLIRHVINCYENTLMSLRAVNREWQFCEQDLPLVSLFSHGGECYSAGAAERGVKALCCSYGLPYRFIHNVAELAKQVPPEWFELVMSMNGSSRSAHTSSYSSEYHESCADSLNRIDRTLVMLDRILDQGLFKPSEEEKQEIFKELEKTTQDFQMQLAQSDVEPRCSDLNRRVASQLEKIRQMEFPKDKSDPG